MNKKIISIPICILLIATVFPATGLTADNEIKAITNTTNEEEGIIFCRMNNGKGDSNLESDAAGEIITVDNVRNGDIVDQQWTEDCGWGFNLLPSYWYAQGFKPSLETLTRVQLYMFKAGDPPSGVQITVSIRDDLYASDLVTILEDASGIPPYNTWVDFDFSDISVTPENDYYIVCRADGGEPHNCYCWLYDINNSYKRGDAWWSFDFGSTWYLLHKPPDWPECDFCFKTYGLEDPPNPPTITGPTHGKAGDPYTYTFTSTDPDGDDVSYYIKWGDGSITDWTDFQASGHPGYSESHTWDEQGEYTIEARAKDTFGAESDWGELTISMPRNRAMTNLLLLRFLEQFPFLERLLSFIKIGI